MISIYGNTDSTFDLDDYNKKSAFKGLVSGFYLFIIAILLSIVLGGLYYVVFTYRNYLDLENKCSIKIQKDIVAGNRVTIFSALKKIKSNDPETYEKICRYVDTIVEDKCILGDNRSPKIKYLDSDGCFIRGTKTIIIKPESQDSETVVKKRTELISKFGLISATYWEGK